MSATLLCPRRAIALICKKKRRKGLVEATSSWTEIERYQDPNIGSRTRLTVTIAPNLVWTVSPLNAINDPSDGRDLVPRRRKTQSC